MNQEVQGPLESKNSLRLSRHAYLQPHKAIDSPAHPLQQSQPQPQPPSQPHHLPRPSQPVQFLEEAPLQPRPTTPNTQQIHKEHRDFLDNYKRQRERERAAKTSSHNHEPAEALPQRRSSSVAEGGRGVSEAVMQRLSAIQEKVAQEIVSQRFHNDRPTFKLFAEVVENKNDIQRVSKERRFLRSQQSRHYEYHEPSMPPRSRLPAALRVRTEGVFDEAQLGRNAREFIERVQKEQERLLGKHLLRRKVEEGKRALEEGEEGRRAAEETEQKREERKMKAEANLLLMKEKVKLAKLIHHHPLEDSDHKNPKDFRYSLRGAEAKKERPRAEIEKMRELNRVATDRLANLKEELSIKERIAIRKHKAYRPTEYREEQGREKRELRTQHSDPMRTQHSDSEQPIKQDPFAPEGLTKQGSSDELEEAPLPTNKHQNEFITFTQYPQQQGEERASRLKHNNAQQLQANAG